MRRNRAQQKKSGFTLLETMVALGILAVGVLGVGASILTAIKYATQSRNATQAMYLAEDQMEIMRLMSAPAVLAMVPDANFFDDADNPIDPDPGDDDTTTFNRRWRIEDDVPEGGLIAITVEVDYEDRMGITRTVRLRTLKACT